VRVFVASSAKTHDDVLIRPHASRKFNRASDGVTRLKRRHDPLATTEELERLQRL
jgi:hypothetical protein